MSNQGSTGNTWLWCTSACFLREWQRYSLCNLAVCNPPMLQHVRKGGKVALLLASAAAGLAAGEQQSETHPRVQHESSMPECCFCSIHGMLL